MKTNYLHTGLRWLALRLDGQSQGMVAMAALALTAGLLGCPPDAPTAELNSGDEVRVVRSTNRAHELIVSKDGKEATVRLVGLYTFSVWPNEKTDVSNYAHSAVDYVKQHVAGRTSKFVLERKELDPRGRYLGFIETNGVDLGLELIKGGHAAVYTEFPFSREAPYIAAEMQPRTGARGLWSSPFAAKRVAALRETWASVRMREFDSKPADPLLNAKVAVE